MYAFPFLELPNKEQQNANIPINVILVLMIVPVVMIFAGILHNQDFRVGIIVVETPNVLLKTLTILPMVEGFRYASEIKRAVVKDVRNFKVIWQHFKMDSVYR